MLVLSRSESEAIRLKNLDVVVKVLKLQGNRVRLGIDAPPHVEIVREELEPKAGLDGSTSTRKQAVELTRKICDLLAAGLTTEARRVAEKLAARLRNVENGYVDHPSAKEQRGLLEQLAATAPTTIGEKLNTRAPQSPHSDSQQATKRGLIVDDNENENRLLASYLRMEKFAIETATHGRDAIGMMQQQDFDFVLLDMQMPEYDGSWTLEQIRGDDSLKDTQVLVVSGHSSSHYGISVSADGCNAWFEKPIDPRTIVRHIRDGFLPSPA